MFTARKLCKFSMAIIAAAMLSVFFTITASAGAVRITEGDYYLCASDDANYCVDIPNNSSDSCTFIHLYQKSADNAAQILTIKHYSGDYYKIIHKSSGLCLNVPGGNNANGQQIWTWSNSDNTDSSLWRFIDKGNGVYTVQNKMGKVLDLDNNILCNGSRLHLWDLHNGASAKWKLVSASTSSIMNGFYSSRQLFSDGTYKINLFDNKNLCLNIIYKSTSEMTATIGVDNYNGESNELFIFKNRGNGYYTIHPAHASWLCIIPNGFDRNLTLAKYNPNDQSMHWSVHKYPTGGYAIQNRSTGYVIDVMNGNYSLGNPAISYTANNYKRAQAFYISMVSSNSSLQPAPAASTWTAPMKNYTTTQSFGNKGHLGIDITNSSDKRILAAADGTVIKTGSNFGKNSNGTINYSKGNGYYVVIEHIINGRKVYSFYGHLAQGSTCVSVNQKVKAGQQIASMGSTGNSTGPHLHFAICDKPNYNGAYYGYTSNRSTFNANSKYESRSGVTFFNPAYVLKYNLP